jgi:hypothetical protein
MSLIAKSLTAAEIAGASLCPCRNRAPAGFPKPAVNNADSPDLFPRSEAIKLKSRRDQISVTNPRKSPSSANARHRRLARTTLCESGIRRFAASTPPKRGASIAAPRI